MMIDRENKANQKTFHLLQSMGGPPPSKLELKFEQAFNRYKHEKQKIFQQSKDNLFCQREEHFLNQMFKMSKNKAALANDQKKKDLTKSFKKKILTGELDPNQEDLDRKVDDVRMGYKDVFYITRDGQ